MKTEKWSVETGEYIARLHREKEALTTKRII